MDFNHVPALVIWELTRACQLACLHCRARAEGQRDAAELTTQEGVQLIDQIAEMGTPLLVMTGGDPLEREDIFELITHARARGLTVAVSPSATPKLSREALCAMKAAGVHRIALSLDGAEAGSHDAFRGVNGSYERTMGAIETLKSIGLPFQIGSTISRFNVTQFDALAAKVESVGAILWSVFFLVPTGRATEEAMITPEEAEAVWIKLADWSHGRRMPVKTTEGPEYRRVVAQRHGRRRPDAFAVNDGRGIAFVSHRGDVCPSGFLPITGGNIRWKPIHEIYRDSTLFKSLRNPSLLKGKCGVCSFNALCGGSRARAYAITGDLHAPDPLCLFQPPAVSAARP